MPSYSRYLDTLVAVASFLGLAPEKHYSATDIADKLSLEQSEVEAVLKSFPGVFRRTKNPKGKQNEYRYTLHLRYARRDGDLDEPLPVGFMSQTLAFLHERADQETRWKSQRLSNFIAVSGALIAAGAAIVAAVVAGR